jgi:hypothetical protein
MNSVFKELISFDDTATNFTPVMQTHYFTTNNRPSSDELLFCVKPKEVVKDVSSHILSEHSIDCFGLDNKITVEIKKVTSEGKRSIVQRSEQGIHRFYRDTIIGEILNVAEHFQVNVAPSTFANTYIGALTCQINIHANKIATETRRAAGNIFIIPRNLLYIIKQHDDKHNFDIEFPEYTDRITKIGTRYGGGKVFFDPYLESNTIIVGYNGGNTVDTGMTLTCFNINDTLHTLTDYAPINYHLSHNFKVGSYYKVMHLV